MNIRAISLFAAASLFAVASAGCGSSDDTTGEEEILDDPTTESEGTTDVESSAATVGGAGCKFVHYKNPSSKIPVYGKSTRGSRMDTVPARSTAYLVQPDGHSSSNGYYRTKNGSLRIQWTMGAPAWIYWKNVSCGG